MEALRTHVAGVDVHKEMLAITVLIGDPESEPGVEQFECLTFTEELMKCGIKLREMGVKDVVMESTGVYWKPIADERSFAAWAGVAAGNNESAGKKKDQSADPETPTSENS